MQVVIIGSGNVGSALGHACHRANHSIVQVYSRTPEHAKSLAAVIGAQPVSHWNEITLDADFYIVALPDAMLDKLHTHFQMQKGLVVHTAGAVPVDTLKNVAPNYGVLYPLQSLHKNMMSYNSIPLLVDGNTVEDKTLIMDFAATLSEKVAYANDEERLKLHVAAVWVNNFPNNLYSIAYDLCRHFGVDFSLLLPMIEHTGGRLHFGTPSEFQTGPAQRGDVKTMETHIALMVGFPAYQELYERLSDEILKKRSIFNERI
jgi:predicted short-subunit dehydrogenase-like oxidoreductase (DUF2520 family)